VATVNFDLVSSIEAGGADNLVTGIDLTTLAGVTQFDRVIIITPAMASTSGVAPGAYEHTGTDASGNWTYSPMNRNY
jgi:hypothetical protein